MMARLGAGDTAALDVLYCRYRGMVRAALLRFAQEITVDEADELTQDVFLTVALMAPKYQRQLRFRAWLYSISTRKARTWRRNTWLHRRILRTHGAACSGTAHSPRLSLAGQIATRDQVVKALERLPVSQREVLWLFAVEGFTGDEISKILGIRPKTVWTRLHRARQTVTEDLTPLGVPHLDRKKP